MTDIGTGSYTIIAQTAAEMMGVPLDASCGEASVIRQFPVSCRIGRTMGRQQFYRRRVRRVYQSCVRWSRRNWALI
jgi:xanthine dehydrogenase YagR molybdenum-binding subunit